MKKSSELLTEAIRLEKIKLDAEKEYEIAYEAYRKAWDQEIEDAKSPELKALESKARSQSRECGCVCGCRRDVRGSVHLNTIYFGRCDDCVTICS